MRAFHWGWSGAGGGGGGCRGPFMSCAGRLGASKNSAAMGVEPNQPQNFGHTLHFAGILMLDSRAHLMILLRSASGRGPVFFRNSWV